MYTNDSKPENVTLSWMYYVRFLAIDFTLLSWITGVIMFVLEAFTVVGNAFVVAVIALDPLKNIRRNPSNHLVLSLAVADFMVGATISFFSGWWYIHYAAYNEDLFDGATESGAIAKFELVAISTANLLALGIDRLIAITVPLRYSYTVTKPRVRIVIASTWFYFVGLAIILTFFPLKGIIKQDFIFNCHGVVTFAGLVITCSIVIRALHKQSNAMKHLSGSCNTLRITVQREKKVTNGSIIITVVFIACFVPFFICQLMEYFCTICSIKYPEVLMVFRIVALLLVVINSMVNPYIYAYRLPKYFQAFKYLGKKLLCRKSNLKPDEAHVEVETNTLTWENNTSEETKL